MNTVFMMLAQMMKKQYRLWFGGEGGNFTIKYVVE